MAIHGVSVLINSVGLNKGNRIAHPNIIFDDIIHCTIRWNSSIIDKCILFLNVQQGRNKYSTRT